MKQRLTNIILFCIILVISLLWNKSCNESKEKDSIIKASNDSLHITYNKLGQQTASIAVFVADSKEMKSLIHSKDSTIAKLAKLVNKHTASATVLNNSTVDRGSSATLLTYDTIPVNDTISPIYSTKWSNKWSEGEIIANKDSISRNITLFNEFNIVQSFDKQSGLKGFFKPRIENIHVTNLNPETKTTGLASFSKPVPKKGNGIWFGIGFATATVLKLIFF